MRFEDLTNYLALRRIATNPWETLRFRKAEREGRDLVVRMREGGPLVLRGGRSDFHMFHRIFLRDEYRLRELVGEAGGARGGANGARPWDCVVDIGANVGVFAARIAPHARRVIACEPFPENHDALLRNVASRANVTALRVAVSDAPGTAKLFVPVRAQRSGTHSLFPTAEDGSAAATVEVPVTTLDALFAEHRVDRCDLLKLDCEGAEYRIVHGAGPATLARVRRIHGEYHDVEPEDPRTRIDAFAAFLRGDAGFARVDVRPHPRTANHGHFFAAR